ncbi:MAG: hypothetical protein K6U74_00580 [Firmicutes bacterium]|nr:hypothetical protein [Bacillota bacterium]
MKTISRYRDSSKVSKTRYLFLVTLAVILTFIAGAVVDHATHMVQDVLMAGKAGMVHLRAILQGRDYSDGAGLINSVKTMAEDNLVDMELDYELVIRGP